jgi:hypothetical protein
MPYKDPLRKQAWEQRNRLRRLGRRRELRHEQRIEGTTVSSDPTTGVSIPWLLLGAGGLMLALYKPSLALGAGGLTLAIAAIQKRSWQWWVLGALMVIVALLVLSSDEP